MPVKAGSGGTALDDDSGRIALTPTEYEEPLELPDGCHHISLSKFLEVRCEGSKTAAVGAVTWLTNPEYAWWRGGLRICCLVSRFSLQFS